MSVSVKINTRTLSSQTTGVQRYLIELLKHSKPNFTEVTPKSKYGGIQGHLWEQAILPLHCRKSILFSPGNTGPLSVSRQVVTIHDLAALDHPEWTTKKFSSWYQYLIPRLVHKAKRIITVSQFTKERLVANTGLSCDKIIVIPNGVDRRFRPRDASTAFDVATKLNLPSTRYFLTTGSLEPRKNLGNLIAAWNMICNDLPNDIWLVIAGGKGAGHIFREIDGSVNGVRIHYTGHVDESDLPELYSGAMAFGYMSSYEGFGLPPLEAMASGVPVITGNRASLPEVVGNAGLMVDPHDVTAIADGIWRLLIDEQLRLNFSILGLQQASRFNWAVSGKLTWETVCGVWMSANW